MDAESPKFTPGQVRLTLVLCFLVAVLEGIDLQVIAVAGPQLRTAMSLSPEQVGVAFSASLVGLAIGAVLGGWIADRTGRKPVLIGSVVLLGGFTISSALVGSFEPFIATRVLAGIGLGGAMPTLIAIMAEVSGGRNTTGYVTFTICGQPTGGVIVALIGGWMTANFGWQGVFYIGGGLTLLIAPLLAWKLVETRPRDLALTRTRARMPIMQAVFGEGRAPVSMLLWLIFILTLALLSIVLSWTPLLVIGKGLPQPIGFAAIFWINIGGILGGFLISQSIDRLGIGLPLGIVYVLMAVSLYFFAHADTPTAVKVTAFFVGLCVLGAQFALYGVAPRLYPEAGRGSGVGVAVAMGRIGSVLGPIVIGAILGTGVSEANAVLVMAPTALAAALALVALTFVTRPAAMSARAAAG